MPPDVFEWLRTDLVDARKERQALAKRLEKIEGAIEEVQRGTLDQSHATLLGRAECQRVVLDRLDKLEKRDIGTMLWDARRTIMGVLTAVLGLAGVAAAAAAPSVLPIIDRLLRVTH